MAFSTSMVEQLSAAKPEPVDLMEIQTMNATLHVYAPEGHKGLDNWLNALKAVVAKHGKGETRNGAEIVPAQGLCGTQDSPANRAAILADKCRCEVCTAFLNTATPVMR